MTTYDNEIQALSSQVDSVQLAYTLLLTKLREETAIFDLYIEQFDCGDMTAAGLIPELLGAARTMEEINNIAILASYFLDYNEKASALLMYKKLEKKSQLRKLVSQL